jgi:hypothetical protein
MLQNHSNYTRENLTKGGRYAPVNVNGHEILFRKFDSNIFIATTDSTGEVNALIRLKPEHLDAINSSPAIKAGDGITPQEVWL